MMGTKFKTRKAFLLWGTASIALAFSGRPAHAVDYEFSNGVDIRFDNTIEYSVAERTAPLSQKLGGPTVNNGNTNDGDQNLRAGIVSNRFDLLSRFDISDNGYGFDATFDSFYDFVYNQKTQNTDAASSNSASKPASEFTNATIAEAGRNIELHDLFIYGSNTIAGIPVSVRVGRQVNLFGESLLFASNGISYGQAPIDIARAVEVPNTQAKDLFLPVGEVSINAQLTDTISTDAYYQFQWQKYNLQPVGDYFSFNDLLDEGGERIIAVYPGGTLPHGAGGYFYRTNDESGKNTGQFGLALHYNPNGTTADFGLYALQYNDSEPKVYVHPSGKLTAVAGPPGGPAAYSLGTYQLVYANNIQTYGASSSATIGPINLAGEVSVRIHEGLNSATPGSTSVVVPLTGPGSNANNTSHPLYAIGDTLHYQASGIYIGPKTAYWGGISAIGEVAADNLFGITENKQNWYRAASKHMALGLRSIVTLSYYEVLPGLDITPNIGVGWNFMGEAPDTLVFNTTGIDRGGDLSFGVGFAYLNEWTGGIKYTYYCAPPARDVAADRDFVAFNVERTF